MNKLNVLKKMFHHLEDSRDRQRIAIALARGGAMRQARQVDLRHPASWEFSGFSQNGEDGVLDVLRSQLREGNRTFLEIGASDGVENNTAWLLVAEKYGGLMIEGDRWLSARAQRNVQGHSIGAECRNMFVTVESLPCIRAMLANADPDVFSLDIDGNDLYVMRAALDAGLRPRIIVVEYNAAFGAERSVTIPYQPDFALSRSHPSQLHYGVSAVGWRTFLEARGYRFVTVERSGVNAFFVDPDWFDAGFLDRVAGLPFAENLFQQRKFGMSSDGQFALIADQPMATVHAGT
ncbi:hypothetical protein [Arenimonas alkanexedens]